MNNSNAMPHSVGAFLKGVGIADVKLDSNNHLLVYLDNGKILDAGQVPASDDALDATSERPVQNKIITAELDRIVNTLLAEAVSNITTLQQTKVDKISGKGLSTKDFTSAHEAKLSSLHNYDDTTLRAELTALSNRLIALVGGNANEAINSFNEIIAFLKGVEDSDSLNGILAGIGTRIAAAEARITAVEVKQREIEGAIADYDAQIESLGGRADAQYNEINIIKGNQQTASVQISALQNRVSSAEADIDSLEIKTATNAGSITSLNNRLSKAEALTRKVEDGSVVVDNTLSELDETSNKPVSGKGVAVAIEAASNSLKARGYIYMGVATPTTTPDLSGGKVFYLAAKAGEYTNFSQTLPTDALTSLEWDGRCWRATRIIDLVTTEEVESIAKTEVAKIVPTIPRTNWSNTESIAISVPQRGIVNIIADSLPTTKTADIKGELEFWDMEGNYFKKCIILNAQGTSSMANAKKNFGIDIVGADWDEDAPQVIKFGNWVAQDSFHLKAYMLDGVRIKSLVGYDFWEDILLSRGSNLDRAWKKALLPSDIPNNSNSITELKLRYDNGAKGHPSGFPIVLYHNGTFYGIYCWQLKKHRDNYHQDKNNANHIHLDGNISDALLWRVGGNIPWEKWAGREVESADINNYDGIEVRNPKSLVLANGTKYDADTNNGELMGYNSPLYDSSNESHLRTAKVREAIESLSARTTALASITSASDKKAAFEAIFDVDSLVDYVLFTLVVGNGDGMKKNWQWTTYDGVKWFVNAYDLDGILGWNGWNYFNPPKNDTALVYTPTIEIITQYYGKRLRMRYAELRTKGIITADNIANKLSNYIRIVGEEAFEQEFNKWGNESPTDSEWRIVEWVKTAIANLDDYYDYPVESLQRYADYEAFGAERTPDGWLLNGVLLTPADIDISWRNRVQGTNLNNAYAFAGQSATNGGRLKTIFPIDNMLNISTRYINLDRAFNIASTIEVIRITKGDKMCEVSNMRNAFNQTSELREIITPLSLEWATNISGAFVLCSKLKEVRLYKLSASISFAGSPMLSKESLLYMINNASTAVITITLHADTLAWASADADVQAALANKTNVTIK